MANVCSKCEWSNFKKTSDVCMVCKGNPAEALERIGDNVVTDTPADTVPIKLGTYDD